MLFLHLQNHHPCSGNVEAAPGTSARVQAVMRIPSCCTVVSRRHPQTLQDSRRSQSVWISEPWPHPAVFGEPLYPFIMKLETENARTGAVPWSCSSAFPRDQIMSFSPQQDLWDQPLPHFPNKWPGFTANSHHSTKQLRILHTPSSCMHTFNLNEC